MTEFMEEDTTPAASDALLTVVATGDETGGICAVVIATLPPHDSGIPAHSHPHHAEGCYVVAGTLALTRDGYTTTLTSGASALVPGGVLHTYWNPVAMPTTIMLIYRPGVTEQDAHALAMGSFDDSEQAGS